MLVLLLAAASPLVARDDAVGLGDVLARFHAPPAAAYAGALRVGLVLDASDGRAASRRRGAQLAATLVQAAGGPRVELRVGSASGPWTSLGDAGRDLLCEQDCRGLLLPPDGDAAHLLAQIAARRQVPVVQLGSDASLTRVPLPWLAQVLPDERAQMRALVESLGDPSGREVAALLPAGRAGRRTRDDLAALARALDVRWVTLAVDGQLDVPALRERLPSSTPVLVWLDASDADAALGALAAAGWSGPVLLPERLLEGAFCEPPGVPGLDARVLRALPSVPGPDQLAFADLHRRTFGVEPDEAAACAFDGLLLLVAALQAEPDTASSPFASWTKPTGLRGATGPILLGGTGERLWSGPVSVLPAAGSRGAGTPARPSSGS